MLEFLEWRVDLTTVAYRLRDSMEDRWNVFGVLKFPLVVDEHTYRHNCQSLHGRTAALDGVIGLDDHDLPIWFVPLPSGADRFRRKLVTVDVRDPSVTDFDPTMTCVFDAIREIWLTACPEPRRTEELIRAAFSIRSIETDRVLFRYVRKMTGLDSLTIYKDVCCVIANPTINGLERAFYTILHHRRSNPRFVWLFYSTPDLRLGHVHCIPRTKLREHGYTPNESGDGKTMLVISNPNHRTGDWTEDFMVDMRDPIAARARLQEIHAM